MGCCWCLLGRQSLCLDYKNQDMERHGPQLAKHFNEATVVSRGASVHLGMTYGFIPRYSHRLGACPMPLNDAQSAMLDYHKISLLI